MCLTANHQNASFDLLEKLSFGAPQAASALVSENTLIDGAVVLATCNRFEAYLDVDASSASGAVDATVASMSAASGVDATELRSAVTLLTGEDVVGHLFAVTSGLESVVVGEDEISGQVRRSLEHARAVGTSSSDLERLFQRATQTSRGVKAGTALGGAGRSLVRLALEMAASRILDWSATRVLIVGTGQYAATTVAALRDRGAVDLRVYSPSGRGEAFAAKYGLRLETHLADGVTDADLLITCTSAMAVDASAFRDAQRRMVIDLGLPRNVDPVVGSLAGVELLDLETISLHAPIEELNAASDARALVGDAAARFVAERSVEPAIVALRGHIFQVLDAELGRARDRGASEETQAALRHLASVLLHGPSVRARELALEGRGDEFTAGIEAVYGVEAATPAELGTEEPGLHSA
nr:glutamyl-tRNA reductase [Galbitalea soli]